MKEFDEWNEQKKRIDNKKNKKTFHERDIIFIKLGKNVGIECGGKGDIFLRPAVVVRKINAKMTLIVPLTRQIKNKWFQVHFEFKEKRSAAVITQVRLVDSKRVLSVIGKMPIIEFKALKKEIQKLFD